MMEAWNGGILEQWNDGILARKNEIEDATERNFLQKLTKETKKNR